MHPLLEKEHQQLIDFLDALDKCISKGNSVNQAYKHLSDFVALAEEHFKNEEAIMEAYKYPEIIDHKKEHADLLEKLFILKSKLGHGHTPFGKDYMQTLRNWLEVHLFDADDRLEKFLHRADANSNKTDS
jgi:hemerythrin-like metal-binding protein